MDVRSLVLGIFIDLLAAPFFYEAATATMSKQWFTASVGYAIGLAILIVGLLVSGIGLPSTTTQVGSSLALWMRPIASDIRWWVVVLLFILIWLGWPKSVEKIKAAWWLFAILVIVLCVPNAQQSERQSSEVPIPSLSRQSAGTPVVPTALNPPAVATIPNSSPVPYQYRNALSASVLVILIGQLHGAFKQNQPLTFVITAPRDNGQFKADFDAMIVAACQWHESGNSLCLIEPAPDPRIAVDTGIPEPKYPGIVVHALDGMPNLLGTMLSDTLGNWFVVHKSEMIPEAIRRLDPTNNDPHLVWFELGSGLPWRWSSDR